MTLDAATAALIGTGIGAVAGLAGAVISSRSGQKQLETRIAAEREQLAMRIEADRRAVAEERTQVRREGVYADALARAHAARVAVESVMSLEFLKENKSWPAPEMFDDVMVRIQAVGSEAVREAMLCRGRSDLVL